MSNSVLLIVNPNSSKGKGSKKAAELTKYFKEKHYGYDEVHTTGIGHAEALACNAVKKGYDTIIAVGGDGTVNEVLNGIMKSGLNDKVKMGIIPTGRGNDFAWCAGIPTDTQAAADLIIKGSCKKTDVGVCFGTDNEDGRYFFNGTGFGFEPMVNFVASEFKRLNGMPSYIAAFLKILMKPPKGYKLKMTIDGEVRVVSTQQVSVANGIRMGSAFKLAPNAEIDDGKLDLMYTNKICTGFSLIALVIKFLSGKVSTDKKAFTYMNAKKVELEADSLVVPAHSDGEVFTKAGDKFSLEIVPGAIALFR